MDRLQEVEHALSADLLRVAMLGAAPPRVADRYVVTRVLGSGASGVVVAAEDTRLRRSVALKLGTDTSHLAEARALAALDHPNVVRVHDVGEVVAALDGKDFRLSMVCMQLVDGRTLREWLRQQPRGWQEVLPAFLAAGRGLSAAHASKLVHRDFKLDNVLIRRDGVAQVIDFGFALTAKSAVWTSSGLQQIAGTYLYMAPEARLGQVTRRSDQYSFGVSMVEAFVGEPRPATGAPPPRVPKAVWVALGRATSTEAADRFPDMDELLQALESGSQSKETRPWLARALWATAVAGLLVGAGGMASGFQLDSLVLATWFASQATSNGTPAASPARAQDGGTPEPADQGIPDAHTDQASAGLAENVDVAQLPPVATLLEADVMDAGPPNRECPDATGVYQLTTRRLEGGLPTDAPYGRYHLQLTGEDPELRAVLTKTGAASGPNVPATLWDALENEEVSRLPDCSIALGARHGARSYRFVLFFRGSVGQSTFAAEGESRRGPFSGTVRITKMGRR